MNNKNKIINKNPYDNIQTFIKKNEYINEKPLIVVKDLKHSFKEKHNEKLIYQNVNFEIFENERLAFLGPNGSGKSLTVATIIGIIKPKKGKIEYKYKFNHNPYEKISVQFQDLQFPNSLTPLDLIKFTIKLNGIDEKDNELLNALEIFEIEKIKNTKMSKLSGGQQQRVNVFLSMLSKPKILFLDEFTTGLDIAIKYKLQNYILEYCKKHKITLVIVSHDIDCIEEMTDRIIILANKKIYVDAYAKDIVQQFGSVKQMLKKYILA